MFKEENVIYGVTSTVSPVTYSTGMFMYQSIIKNIHKGTLFPNIFRDSFQWLVGAEPLLLFGYDERELRKLLLNEVTGEKLTYESFLEHSCRLADSLIKYGIVSEDIVSLCCENCNEHYIPVMASLFAGIPICLTNSLYTECELIHAFSMVQPVIVFCSTKNVDKMLDLKEKYSKIKEIIVINSDKSITGAWNLKEFISKYSERVDIYNYKPVQVDVENHVAFIMFSSGTSGLPKGVMTTHKNVNYKNAMLLEPRLNVKKEAMSQHVLGFLPCFHVFGLHTVMSNIILGRTIIVLERFDFELHLKLIQKYKITTIAIPPPILQMYAKDSLMDQYDLSHVEFALVAGAPMSEALHEIVKKRTGIKSIGQGYGMTETTFAIVLTTVYKDRPKSCGRLMPNLTGVVKDLETRRNLGPYQKGEFCFKGGMIMKGYYQNEIATKNSFTEDGYLKTGDIGYYDEEGYFYVVDRLKDIIKYKGYQVSPVELEGVLLTNPKIKTAAVIGIGDEIAGELPMAFVVKQPGVELTEDKVIDYVKRFVAPTKYLRGGVVFVNDIPVNPSGKILRRKLRE